MIPPIFPIVAADSECRSLLGVSPTRFYPFDEAPEWVTKPYAVFQIVSGSPENNLSDLPDTDFYTLQVDVYSDTANQCRQVAQALRDAIEPHAHIVRWGGESREAQTRLYRYSFDVDWWVNR